MDEEARQRLIAEATVQNARDEAKRARVNMPIGLALVAVGVTLATLARICLRSSSRRACISGVVD